MTDNGAVTVFQLTCDITKRRYIGRTRRSEKELLPEIVRNSRRIEYHDSPLHKDIRRFGIANFKFESLAVCTFRESGRVTAVYQEMNKTLESDGGYNRIRITQPPTLFSASTRAKLRHRALIRYARPV